LEDEMMERSGVGFALKTCGMGQDLEQEWLMSVRMWADFQRVKTGRDMSECLTLVQDWWMDIPRP
jgi:hypothetical protein